MTTKQSPLSALKAQADKIAAVLKSAERGEWVSGKLAAARAKPSFKAGIFMDDKMISLELPWTLVRDTEEAALSEYIVNLMCETRNPNH